ncbi:unnamed protein product [Soboliphyme baturini]|uniref:Uncharacterized protein n=1 Tax=Soboliphyme baturini TaxID=241478 RepID=A0A183J9Q5_9BILA|nr:unnamed protein product [Soboliphyme baturini]
MVHLRLYSLVIVALLVLMQTILADSRRMPAHVRNRRQFGFGPFGGGFGPFGGFDPFFGGGMWGNPFFGGMGMGMPFGYW